MVYQTAHFCSVTRTIAVIVHAGNTVYLYTEMPAQALAAYYVRYGYLNMEHCSVGDENGHLLPDRGPLLIAELL